MKKIDLVKNGEAVNFFIEKSAFSGVKKIAQKVCGDVELVTGIRPVLRELDRRECGLLDSEDNPCSVFIGTVGKSRMLTKLCGVKLDIIRNGYEQYLFDVVETEHGSILVIAGSDKRGTIYGLFHLSELMGVSPWVRFSDVLPTKQAEILINEQDCLVSKRPSVKYRGFFINDEWPAFGNWTFEHFGGFTAQMYDMIFETLLRLKGNYLWPAMWTSSFTLDGPGEENARLADEYGIVMCNSHHEPCLRHSEEWDLVRGEESPYGNEWSYRTNKEGLLRYWEDGLLRSGKYENIITIGMRGERDSMMLGADAGLKENIDLLKEIITEQRKLICKCVGKDAPQMLALYKEVEAYFYGNKGAHDGLCDWDGLDGVTLMLCEDNFGNLRTLPMEEQKNRPGGWGMYYHFDYHGGPISYEWVNSSYLPKVWEQMSRCYESGVREIWVVNVGDLKFQEYPLSFFMDLAYDYEAWGGHNLSAPQQYLEKWLQREFGGWVDSACFELMQSVMKGYTKLNHNRKPEAMSPKTYHPVHFSETRRVLEQCETIDQKLEMLFQIIPQEMMPAFWELIYYPAKGSVNVQKLNLYAGLNHYFAGMGAMIANDFAEKMEECIRFDHKITEVFHAILDRKWNGMGASEHIGFVNWNDEECVYPVKMYVEPANKPRILAYVKGDGDIFTAGGDWTGKTLTIQTKIAQKELGTVVLLNGGKEFVEYQIQCDNPDIIVSKPHGLLQTRDEVRFLEGNSPLLKETTCWIRYSGGNIRIRILPKQKIPENLPEMTFVEENGMISIESAHFAMNEKTQKGEFVLLPEYGRTESAMKALLDEDCLEWADAPYLEYHVWLKKADDYLLFLYTAPANPSAQWERMVCALAVNGGNMQVIPMIPDNYASGEPSCAAWAQMVLDQIRITEQEIHLRKGMNTLRIYAPSEGFILEKLVLVIKSNVLPESYLGPEESYYVK